MPCYQPTNRRPKGPGELLLIAIIGVPAIYLGIRAFFGAMPVIEAFGRFICHHLIGGGL